MQKIFQIIAPKIAFFVPLIIDNNKDCITQLNSWSLWSLRSFVIKDSWIDKFLHNIIKIYFYYIMSKHPHSKTLMTLMTNDIDDMGCVNSFSRFFLLK